MKQNGLLFSIILSLTLSVIACSKMPIEESEILSSAISSESTTNTSTNTCNEHVFVEETKREATILEQGLIVKTCEKCGHKIEKEFYDLKEFAFESKTKHGSSTPKKEPKRTPNNIEVTPPIDNTLISFLNPVCLTCFFANIKPKIVKIKP